MGEIFHLASNPNARGATFKVVEDLAIEAAHEEKADVATGSHYLQWGELSPFAASIIAWTDQKQQYV